MNKTIKKNKPISAEAIARMASQGKDITRFFTNEGHMVQLLGVDFTVETLEELDHVAKNLNISRRRLIKALVREGLDRRTPRQTIYRQRAARVRGPNWSPQTMTK
jgi:hypothetical protein